MQSVLLNNYSLFLFQHPFTFSFAWLSYFIGKRVTLPVAKFLPGLSIHYEYF